MKISRSSRLAIAVLTAGLIMGGTGGAIAAGQIGSHDIRNGAVTTSKLHNKAVTSPKIRHGAITTADLASSARGAKVVQYVASGASINANFVTVRLPGIWTVSKLGKSSWSVELVSLPNPGTGLFVLSQSAPAGEGTADGFYIVVRHHKARVFINAPSWSGIDTIRITRAISTSQVSASVSKRAPRAQPPATR